MRFLQIVGLLLVPLWANMATARLSAIPHPKIFRIDVPREGPVVDKNGTELPPLNHTYYFDQLIDHTNPNLGTFKQRYWHTWEFYESGGPIILTTPGEQDGAGFESSLTNLTVNGQIAQQENGATIVLEHRFYGLSNPYNNLSVESLRYHTIQQAIDDLEYFAYNVKLAMPGGGHVTPDEAPWILIGGSYAGALTSFTKVNKPGLFHAAWSSSGVVQSIVNYWGYFDVIRKHMPQNCSADVQAVVAHIDSVFTSYDTEQIDDLKSLFNMSGLSHLDDFASALVDPISMWQDMQPAPELSYTGFFDFCDALEVKNGTNAPAEGWGLDHALQAWASWWTESYYPATCGDSDADTCFGTYDPTSSMYTNITVNNADRSWMWIVCNQMGFFQDGAPIGTPSIVSRLITPAYTERQCMLYFPEAFSETRAPNVTATNEKYHGWFVESERLFFANGERDPWRDATKSADGTHFPSTPEQPIVVGDGFHCSDLYTVNGQVDPTIIVQQQQGLAAMKRWLEGWEPAARKGNRLSVDDRLDAIDAAFTQQKILAA